MDERAVRQLVEAIRNPGSHPQHHREVMARHRKEWPTLWRAIDEVLRADQTSRTVKVRPNPPVRQNS